jgi:hypothetical protein
MNKIDKMDKDGQRWAKMDKWTQNNLEDEQVEGEQIER